MQAAHPPPGARRCIRFRARERLVSFSTRLQLRKETPCRNPAIADRRRSAPRTSSRSKRAAILEVATDQFGREGYEHSKWADVAAAVGIGSTALYHYFESKLALPVRDPWPTRCAGRSREVRARSPASTTTSSRRCGRARRRLRPDRARGPAQPPARLRAGRSSAAPHVRARGGGAPARALADARPRVRVGDVPHARDGAGRDPRGRSRGCSPRAILGLYNSVFHWYRPRGGLALSDVGDFYVSRCLAVAGLPMGRARAASGGAAAACAVTARLAARDRHVVDLVGAVGDLQDPGDRVELGRAACPALTPAPPWAWMARSMTHVATSGAATLIADTSIRAPRLPTVSMSQAVLSTSRRTCSILHPRLGDPALDDAVVDDRPPEGGPRRGASGTSARARARPSRSPACVVDPAGAEALLGDPEPVALLAEQVRGRDADVVVDDLGVPAVGAVVVAEQARRALDLDARACPSGRGSCSGGGGARRRGR